MLTANIVKMTRYGSDSVRFIYRNG